jgi:hypothetical protein
MREEIAAARGFEDQLVAKLFAIDRDQQQAVLAGEMQAAVCFT